MRWGLKQRSVFILQNASCTIILKFLIKNNMGFRCYWWCWFKVGYLWEARKTGLYKVGVCWHDFACDQSDVGLNNLLKLVLSVWRSTESGQVLDTFDWGTLLYYLGNWFSLSGLTQLVSLHLIFIVPLLTVTKKAYKQSKYTSIGKLSNKL